MNDDAPRMVRDAPIPWDEVRQQRVLSRIEARLAAGRGQDFPANSSSHSAGRRVLPWAVAGVAAAAAIVLAVWGVGRLPLAQGDGANAQPLAMEHAVSQPPNLTALEQPAATMALADGSVAFLHDAARVDVDVQTEDLVRLLQHNGVVRYEVAPNPARRFVVDAQGVEVRVIGTVFTVEVGTDRVRVDVERGRVAVESSESMAELGAGDEISVDIEPEETLVILDEDPTDPTDPTNSDESPDAGERPRHRPKPAQAPPVAELLRRADTARAGGKLAEAAATLSELVRRYPKDPRTYSSYFQLGKVERARGHHGAAASAFAACYKRAPLGALSEDARAEAAVSWLDAGQAARAGKAARTYLEQYPQGAHAKRMRRILERTQ